MAAVPVSAKKLDQRKAAIDKLAGKAVPRAVSGRAADPRTGKIVIKVQTGKRSKAVDAFVARVAKAGAVSVEDVAAEAPRTFAAGTVTGMRPWASSRSRPSTLDAGWSPPTTAVFRKPTVAR